MNVEFREFRTEDLPAVGEFLNRVEPSRDPVSWQKAIVPCWPWDGDVFGQMLVIDGVLSGVVCQLQCRRRYGEKIRTGCNIASWYVLPELQGKGFGVQLLGAALSNGDWVYTNQTPEPYTINAFKRVGFEVIDTTEWIIPNVPRWRRGDFVEASDIAGHLSGEALKNFTAHAELPSVGHVGLMGPDDTFCHIAFVRSRWHKLSVARIIYASNYEALTQCIPAFSHIALMHYGLLLTAIEKRRCAKRPEMAIADRWKDPILYRGDGIHPDQIDSLYCEVVSASPNLR